MDAKGGRMHYHLGAVLFLAAALSNGAALAQILETPGGATVQVGTAVPLRVTHIFGHRCEPAGGCSVRCFYEGAVRLREGSAVLETIPLPASATYSCAEIFAPGFSELSISFSSISGPAGNRTFDAQWVRPTVITTSNSVQVTWNKATSSTSPVGISPIPTLSDTSVTLSATVTGFVPTGNVDFKNGGAIVASAPISSGGTASITKTLGSGTYNLVADYVGDANNLASSSSTAAPAFTVTLAPAHAAAIQLIIESLLLDD